MKLKFANQAGADPIFSIDAGDELTLGELKALCNVKCGIPVNEMKLVLEGRLLTEDGKCLKELGIRDGQVLLLQPYQKRAHPLPFALSQLDFSAIKVPTVSAPKSTAIVQELEKANGLMDPKTQKRIADEIRRQNVAENMEKALEFNPESFANVFMLYINCKVNGHPAKAFIDSGCQTTFMSAAFADQCNLSQLIDTRFTGIAHGVGTQPIVGKIHVAQMEIGGVFLPCSFSIMKDQAMSICLGLDMLRGHQCAIDLNKNVLHIGTTGTEIAFLPEAELPKFEKADNDDDDAEIAKAIEESFCEDRKNKRGSSPSDSENKNKKPKMD